MLGRKFILHSDYTLVSLLILLDTHVEIPQVVSNRLQNWALNLFEFNYELKYSYIKEVDNVAADELFRLSLNVDKAERDNEYSYIDFKEGSVPIDF